MHSATLRVLAAAVAAAAIVGGVLTSHFGFVVLALAALLFLATAFSVAARLTRPLQALRGDLVDVSIWGAPLPVPADAAIRITSVKALGAGLHVYLRIGIATSPVHLKVAQPRHVHVTSDAVAIESAAYVQWSGRRLPRVPGASTLTIRVKAGASTDSQERVA